ncbi:putative lipase [Paenibacillus sp. TCA20]|uniref:hypothetical protein n=1 Tax=Paenibacillus sp. TCA20 TaxID=1499968 RepID=UPI0004DAE9B4|nr:hypothetical protein [Paenibacillus sp. TCA20]GAK41583.1 putative lipase [Paenibacillus sp. TCA20]
MKENPNLQVYQLSDVSNLKVHGRTTGRLAPLTLFWTGSGIELNSIGSELGSKSKWTTVSMNSGSRF